MFACLSVCLSLYLSGRPVPPPACLSGQCLSPDYPQVHLSHVRQNTTSLVCQMVCYDHGGWETEPGFQANELHKIHANKLHKLQANKQHKIQANKQHEVK